MAIGSALSVGLIGLKAFIIQIQAFISPGLPYFSIIGLPDTSLSEARERVKSACQASGFKWPETRVTVNLSPASMPKKGSSHDLAIAASVLSASGTIGHDCLADTIVLGEVNLDGTVLPVNGLLPIMLHAREQGIRQVIVPHANIDEARLIDDIDVIGVRHVGELIELMGGHATYHIPDTQRDIGTGMDVTQCSAPGDMCEVVGQESTKWALEVAAAGGHHLLMTGPPGTGKTMLASRMPGIMSPLNETEQLEIASIRSLCGTLPSYGITDVPPFEAPHHTASMASLVGGGTGLAQPGAITRAHRGILFMDEAPEFSARALQTLREPLESGYVAISRSKGTTYYPARFQLIMAATHAPAVFPMAMANVAPAKRRTASNTSAVFPVRFSTVSTFKSKCCRSTASIREADRPANPATQSDCGSWWPDRWPRNASANTDGPATRKPPARGCAPIPHIRPSHWSIELWQASGSAYAGRTGPCASPGHSPIWPANPPPGPRK